MASPHVAGIAAAIFGRYPTATQAQIQTILLGDATTGRVSDTRGSPNRLAFTSLETPAPGTLTVDDIGPTTTRPVATLRAGPSLSGSKARIRLTWSGNDGDGSGINHYTLAREAPMAEDTGPCSCRPRPARPRPSRFRPPGRSGTGSGRSMPSGTSVPGRSGPVLSPRLIQQSTSSIRYRGPWRRDASPALSGGTATFTKVTRAKARYTFSGRSIGFVTTTAPNRGAVRIFIDGTHQATVDLRDASTNSRVVAWQRTWSSSAKRTIKIVAIGSAGHRRVDLDAFVVLR